MEENNPRRKEVVLDIEGSGGVEARHGAQPRRYNGWGNALNNLFLGVFGFNAPGNGEARTNSDNESVALLVDGNPGGLNNHGLGDQDRERRKNVPFNKASKPPRPPRGPYLDAADMRLVKELSKIAMKKRERMKTLKKMKAARLLSQSSQSVSSPSSSGAVSALIITVLFFLVLVFQGFSSYTTSSLILVDAPQPAPETTTAATSGLTPVEFYEAVLADDGAAPGFIPPKYAD